VSRFKFSLERVLKHKERRERLAEMRQQRALVELRAREAAAATLRNRLESIRAELPSAGALDLAAWLANFRHAERLTRELDQADIEVIRAARSVQEASAQRRQQALEAEALRQLRQRRQEEHVAEAARAEQLFLDEQGLRRWQQPADDTAMEQEP
jgi:flagellar export protein FliJ